MGRDFFKRAGLDLERTMSKGKYIGQELVVHAPHQKGTIYSVDSLCIGRTIVLKMFRSFACPFTRYDAQQLSQQKKALEALDAELVGIGFDELGVPDFSLCRFWEGELFLDHDRQVYDYLRLPRMSKVQAMKNLMRRNTRDLYYSLKQDLGGGVQGDFFQTGGTFVINCNGRILYSCPQPDVTEFSDIPDIIKACKREFLHRQNWPVPTPKLTTSGIFDNAPAKETPASALLANYFQSHSTPNPVS